jgi:hypothetical protein
LSRANRGLYIQVASYAGQAWYATFAVDGGTFTRAVLDQAALAFASAMFSGTNGGSGLVQFCPTATMRVEAATNLTATTSFCVVEIPR